MSDPMNQSSKISSSQGLNDGHTSTSKDSKFSDSFFSLPVSVIQSPQEKEVLSSDKPTKSLATSSQESSFPPVAYVSESSGLPENQKCPFDSSFGSQNQDSPIKMSPVSERIKAIEALAAKQNEFDKNDGGSLQFKERHYEKFPIESQGISSGLSIPKKVKSTEQDLPEFPFEVPVEARCGNDFEETVDWMKAHLPPAPDFNIEDPNIDVGKYSILLQESPTKVLEASNVDAPDVPKTFIGVPDQFMDSPIEMTENNYDNEQAEQESVEEETGFDLRFLPTAYMWDKQGKPYGDTECYQIIPDNVEFSNSPAPSAELESAPPNAFQKIDDSIVKHCSTSEVNLEPTEILEINSSEESDDTVIDEGGSNQLKGNDYLETKLHKEIDLNQIKQQIQVPIINVIETEEPTLSDEEEQTEVEEDEDDIKGPVILDEDQWSTKQCNECSDVVEHVSIGNQNEENKSDPESFPKNDSDAENSHKNLEIEDDHESGIFLQCSPDSGGLNLDDFELKLPASQTVESTEGYEEPEKTAEILSDTTLNSSNFCNESRDVEMFLDHCTSDKLNDNQSTNTLVQEFFKESVTEDYDKLNDHNLNLKSTHVSSPFDPSADVHVGIESVLPQKKFPSVDLQDEYATLEPESFTLKKQKLPLQAMDQPTVHENPPPVFPSFHNKQAGHLNDFASCPVMIDVADQVNNSKPRVLAPRDNVDGTDSPDAASYTDNIETEFSGATTTDSFVEFMRECLKSKQYEESSSPILGHVSPDQSFKSSSLATALANTQSSPETIMDLEQECLTISALKKLDSSQEQEDENPLTVSSTTAQTISYDYEPDALFPNEVEAIDIWVAEAYHLAEHVLTAILIHLTVNDLVHWRDPKKSGVVFGVSLLLLLSLAAFSVISVVSYLLLALLCVTISFRIYKTVMQAVQKNNEGHPFKALMEKDVTLPPETFRKHVDLCLTHINRVLKKMSRLFLVEDLVDSLKLAVVMWLLTYVGAVFNGITILILVDILLFSVPPIYEKNKTQIDRYIDIVQTQVNNTISKLQEKLPGAMKRSKAE